MIGKISWHITWTDMIVNARLYSKCVQIQLLLQCITKRVQKFGHTEYNYSMSKSRVE